MKALRAAAGMGVLLLLGCIDGASFNVAGYHVSPNALVEVQVLSSPTADPTNDANWTAIGTATSSASATVINGDSLYPWSTSVVPVPSDPFQFMPHAEHPMRKFWASGARAYLNAWTGDTTGCKP